MEHGPSKTFREAMHTWCNEWLENNKSWQPKINSLSLWGKNHGVLISHNYAWCHTQFAKVVVHFAKTHMEPENYKPSLQERLTHLNKNDWNHYHWPPPTTHHHHHQSHQWFPVDFCCWVPPQMLASQKWIDPTSISKIFATTKKAQLVTALKKKHCATE